MKNGLLYLPIDNDGYDDDEMDIRPTGFLSNLMKNYITFGDRSQRHDSQRTKERAETKGKPVR
jgi:hypothetical protein